MNYQVGQEVWVKCASTDTWVAGVVTGLTAKRVRVFNEVRGLEGLYAPQNVELNYGNNPANCEMISYT